MQWCLAVCITVFVPLTDAHTVQTLSKHCLRRLNFAVADLGWAMYVCYAANCLNLRRSSGSWQTPWSSVLTLHQSQVRHGREGQVWRLVWHVWRAGGLQYRYYSVERCNSA